MAVALAGPGRNAATAGEGLGLQQFTVDTDMRKTRPFCKVDSELNQMVKDWCGDDGFQPELQSSYRSAGVLCLLEQFCVDFTRNAERECQRNIPGTYVAGERITQLWTIKRLGNIWLITACYVSCSGLKQATSEKFIQTMNQFR